MPDKKRKSASEVRSEAMRASSEYLGHGFAIAASVALFGWLGYLLGGVIGGRSVLTLGGIFLGGAAGFYRLYTHLVLVPRKRLEEETEEENS